MNTKIKYSWKKKSNILKQRSNILEQRSNILEQRSNIFFFLVEYLLGMHTFEMVRDSAEELCLKAQLQYAINNGVSRCRNTVSKDGCIFRRVTGKNLSRRGDFPSLSWRIFRIPRRRNSALCRDSALNPAGCAMLKQRAAHN